MRAKIKCDPASAITPDQPVFTRFSPADIEVDVAQEPFLVTGAKSGFGKVMAKDLAQRAGRLPPGGTAHMVCRNRGRAQEANGEIMTDTCNQNIFLHILDISNPKEIWKFAEKFRSEHKLQAYFPHSVSSHVSIVHWLLFIASSCTQI
ncbi:dehydrogenase/reductase SDR family member 12 [Eudromia elegans]